MDRGSFFKTRMDRGHPQQMVKGILVSATGARVLEIADEKYP